MNKMSKNKLLAFAVVAMFAIAVIPVMADDSEAGPYGGVSIDGDSTKVNQKFTVNMSTGQEFTYANIATTLDGYGNTTFSWDNVSGNAVDATGANGIKWDLATKTLSGKFTTAGTHVGKLTANWTSPDNTGVTQTATQQITFIVTDAVELIQTITAHAQVGATTDKTVVAITYTGGSDLVPTVKYGSADGSTTNNTPFTISHDSDNKEITVKPTATLDDSDEGQYKAYVTLTNSKTNDADTVEIILNVYKGVSFGNTVTHFYTYEGGQLADLEFTISYETDGKDETSVTSKPITIDGQPISSTGVLTSVADAPNKVHVNTAFTNAGDITGTDQNFKDFVATMNVTGSIPDSEGGDGPTTSTAELDMIVTIYKSFQFTSEPKVENVKITNAAVGSNSMNLSAYIAGAKSVEFNWGDGTTSKLTTSDVANTYAANHTYAQKGVYMITISATNDMGTTTSKVMYNADTTPAEGTTNPDQTNPGDGTSETPAEEDKGLIAEHGWMFILFAVLTAGCVVAFFILGYQHPLVLVLAIVFAVLTVLCYLYVDFGGIIDAAKGLFDGKA